MMVLLHDPGRLFSPGATFPAGEVLAPWPGKPEEAGDRWYIGTRFKLIRRNAPPMVYIFDGDKVRPE